MEVEEETVCVGETFSSFENLQIKLKAFEERTHVQLSKRSSRSIAALRKRAPNRTFNDALQFAELDYGCVHSGSFKSKGSGLRPNHSTFKKECPFFLKIRTTADGQKLILKTANLEHNHEISKVAFESLPRQRKLKDGAQEQVRTMLSMKADKKLIQQHVRQEYEKRVTLKDLHNLDGSRKSSSFNVETVVEELRTSPGAVVEVVEREGVLDGIFFQKQEWLDMYKKYPEILLIDATYKVNDLKMPLYIMLCIDGNGQSQIIALWIMRTEDRPSMKKMVQFFKKHNNVAPTRCVMADKDWVERDVVKEEMPNAYLLICLFHTLRTFGREVTEKKMNISSGERQQCLRLLQEMAYADSEEAYQRLFEELQEKNIRVHQYVTANWHPIRHQWVQGLMVNAGHLLTRTNNRLEAINHAIKSVIGRNSNLLIFFRELMQCLSSMAQEREHRAILVFQKEPTCRATGELGEFQKFLTPFAFAYLKQQFDAAQLIEIPPHTTPEIQLQRSEGTLTVSSSTCTCGFFKASELPCRHMLAVRMQQEIPLFCNSICGRRWSKEYYKGTYRIRETVPSEVGVSAAPVQTRIPSQNERYNKAFRVAQRLCAVAAGLPLRQFSQAMNVMEDLAQAWENGRFVELGVFSGPDGEPHPSPSTSLPQTSPEPSVSASQASPARPQYQTAGARAPRTPPGQDVSNIRHNTSPARPQYQTAGARAPRTPPGQDVSNIRHNTSPARSHYQTAGARAPRTPPGQDVSNIRHNTSPARSHYQTAGARAPRTPPGQDVSNIRHNTSPARSHYQTAGARAPRTPPGQDVSNIRHNTSPAGSRYQTAGARAPRAPPPSTIESGMSPPPPHADLPLSQLRLPSRMKSRGRPKGSDITVIGLPKQKKSRLGPMAFAQKLQSEKEEVILGWLVPNLSHDYRETLLSVADLPKQSGHLPLSLLDENVDLVTVQKFFDRGAWLLILSMIDNMRRNTQYNCKMCQLSLGLHTQAIVCDACLLWFHIKCATSKGAVPKGRFWFCRKCRNV